VEIMSFFGRGKKKEVEPFATGGYTQDESEGTPAPASTPERKLKAIKKAQNKPRLLCADIYSPECIVGTSHLGKKDIDRYIRSEAETLLGPDFYYGYVYHDGQLSFVATKSDSHPEGSLSVFTPALLNIGTFCYRIGASFHVLVTDEYGHTTETRVYTRPEDAIPIDPTDPIERRTVPATLFLKWSMKKSKVSLSLISGVAFIVAMLSCLGVSLQYDQVARAAHYEVPPPPNIKVLKLNADMGGLADKVAKDMGEKGLIKSIKSQGDILLLTLIFKTETDSRAYLEKQKVAIYDNGEVKIGLEPSSGNYLPPGGRPAAPPPPPPANPAPGGAK
jgi:hypothetical protein